MKNLSVKSFAVLTFIALITIFSTTAIFGQQEPTNNTQAQTENKVRVGIGLPKANFAEGVDNNQMAAGLRDLIGQYFQGTNVEIVALEARLASSMVAEAKEKECDYVLNVAVSQKKGGGGFGMFKAIAPVISNVVPMAGMSGNVASQVVGSVAQTAITTAANMSSTTKSKDQFTFEYSLVSTTDNAVKASNSVKAKAKSDGEDVLSPMVEKMAEAVVAAAVK